MDQIIESTSKMTITYPIEQFNNISQKQDPITELHEAIENQEWEEVGTLIDRCVTAGKDLHSPNENGDPALILLIQNEAEAELIEKLLNSGVDVNTPDRCGRTALHWAIQLLGEGADNQETIQLLSDWGGKIYGEDNKEISLSSEAEKHGIYIKFENIEDSSDSDLEAFA